MRRFRSASRPALARGFCPLALLALSCTKFASELDQLDSEGAALQPARLDPNGGDWSCVPGAGAPVAATAVGSAATVVSAASAPAAALATRAPLTHSFSLIDFVTAAPIKDVRVKACFRADVDCGSPASEQVPDRDGIVHVTAYVGFNGYLEIISTGMLPELLFFGAPWSAEYLVQLERTPVRLLPAPALQALGETARLPLDPDSGVIGLYAYDCAGLAAPGVRLEIDTGAVPYAFVDDLPVANQDVTSTQGLAGFVNVAPGVVVVRAFPRGETEALTVESLLVRSGWLSTVSLLPAFSR